jgi:hypothetical protein
MCVFLPNTLLVIVITNCTVIKENLVSHADEKIINLLCDVYRYLAYIKFRNTSVHPARKVETTTLEFFWDVLHNQMTTSCLSYAFSFRNSIQACHRTFLWTSSTWRKCVHLVLKVNAQCWDPNSLPTSQKLFDRNLIIFGKGKVVFVLN